MRLDTHIMLQVGKDTSALQLAQMYLDANEGAVEPEHILKDHSAVKEYRKWEKKRDEGRSLSMEKSMRFRSSRLAAEIKAFEMESSFALIAAGLGTENVGTFRAGLNPSSEMLSRPFTTSIPATLSRISQQPKFFAKDEAMYLLKNDIFIDDYSSGGTKSEIDLL